MFGEASEASPGEEGDTADEAFEDEFQKKWASDLVLEPPTIAAELRVGGEERAGGNEGSGDIAKSGGKSVDTEGVLNAFDNALVDWFGDELSGRDRTVPGAVTKKTRQVT